MEYRIIESSSPSSLSVLVNAAIKDGWKPQGGVNGFYTVAGYLYQQAMVKAKH